ncbi:hypothetical protein VNO77_42212 [Canavalia gladiata]|uniref:ENTH domain-containing protein n=1 Tax=Canavalia gladiata TaxID=3824 RepID=A0AAN9K288_CANGL
MRLWKRAKGALKDKYSIWVAKLSPSGPFRNPDLETVIIKATSHDEQGMDYKSVQRVFQWLRTSPLYLKPLLYSLSMRMEKTRSWVVALKGLMLIHGVFCFDLPNVQNLGRLPFDFSHFIDGHMNPQKAWVHNAFVRSYFAYVDKKSAFVRLEATRQNKRRNNKEIEETVMEELQNLERLQNLIDLLLQIKPRDPSMNVVLVFEAMDCVMDEVLEVYGKFCKVFRRVLLRVFDVGGKEEAMVALDVVKKTELQGSKLTLYFEFCRELGALNVSEYPQIMRIDNKEVDELRRIMMEGNDNDNDHNNEDVELEDNNNAKQLDLEVLKTVITDQWEVFDDDDDDDLLVNVKESVSKGTSSPMVTTNNPFLDSLALIPYAPVYNNLVLPDLIIF